MSQRSNFYKILQKKYNWKWGHIQGDKFYYYQKNIQDFEVYLSFMGQSFKLNTVDFNKEIWIGDILFRKKGKEVSVKNVPQIILSEIYMNVKELADSGSGFNENYKETSLDS